MPKRESQQFRLASVLLVFRVMPYENSVSIPLGCHVISLVK